MSYSVRYYLSVKKRYNKQVINDANRMQGWSA